MISQSGTNKFPKNISIKLLYSKDLESKCSPKILSSLSALSTPKYHWYTTKWSKINTILKRDIVPSLKSTAKKILLKWENHSESWQNAFQSFKLKLLKQLPLITKAAKNAIKNLNQTCVVFAKRKPKNNCFGYVNYKLKTIQEIALFMSSMLLFKEL